MIRDPAGNGKPKHFNIEFQKTSKEKHLKYRQKIGSIIIIMIIIIIVIIIIMIGRYAYVLLT